MAGNLDSLNAILGEGERLKEVEAAATRELENLDSQIAQTKVMLRYLEARREKAVAETQTEVLGPAWLLLMHGTDTYRNSFNDSIPKKLHRRLPLSRTIMVVTILTPLARWPLQPRRSISIHT